MKNSYIPILVVILGATLYQIAQKSVPKTANPLLVIIIAYCIGIAACIVWIYLYPMDRSLFNSIKELNWSTIGIGIGAISIEIGYLFAYRAGGDISLTSLITSIAIALLLIPVGLIVYKESLSVWNSVGIFLCIIGLILISKK